MWPYPLALNFKGDRIKTKVSTIVPSDPFYLVSFEMTQEEIEYFEGILAIVRDSNHRQHGVQAKIMREQLQSVVAEYNIYFG